MKNNEIKNTIKLSIAEDGMELIVNALEHKQMSIEREIEEKLKVWKIYKKNGTEDALKMMDIVASKIEKLQTLEEDLYSLEINLKNKLVGRN